MKISIKALQLKLTPSITTFIEDKLGTLAKYLKKFEPTGQPAIWLEIMRTTRHHKRGFVYAAEADLRLPGKILRAEHEDVDIRVAIQRLRDKLKLEIEKYKTKTGERPRRAA